MAPPFTFDLYLKLAFDAKNAVPRAWRSTAGKWKRRRGILFLDTLYIRSDGKTTSIPYV